MLSALVKLPPPGEFAYVSALNTSWHEQLQTFIGQKRPVTYDHYPLRQFPEHVLEQARQQGYEHLILEHDRWQHFFIPSTATACPKATATT